MMHKSIIIFSTIIFLLAASLSAESAFMKKFNDDYKQIDLDLLRHEIEELDITDFTYQKDIATFHFKSGKMYLLRYIDNRPTTAIFIGEATASINIPARSEQNSLLVLSGKKNVEETFEVCFIRMADDFDLALKKFPSIKKKLKWKDFAKAKEAQGEFFFKPNINHFYDNYFQLIRSLYERNADGYFWVDFNRYNFTYDPNRPLPVVIGYEFEPNDLEITDAVELPAGLTGDISDYDISNVTYPVTAIDHYGTLDMNGLDGSRLESAESTMKVVINIDSLKFVSTFMHYNLDLDSIYFNGQPVDYHRRKDFAFIGIILPEYHYQGDTLTFTYWYDGKNYDYIMPYVEDFTPSHHAFTFTVPKGYNYIMPDQSEIKKVDGGKISFSVDFQSPTHSFYFQGIATNFDTLSKISSLGMPIHFLKSKSITKKTDCYVPDEIYEPSIMNAFNFMSSKMGAPIGAFGLYVYPEGFMSMPGMVQVPQILCYDPGLSEPLGGFNIFSGYSMSKQWFGKLMRPKSPRETWLATAAADYLSMMNIQHNDGDAYFSALLLRKDSLALLGQRNLNRPLYRSDANSSLISTNKGIWFFHMLRYMMLDLETGSDADFLKFFNRLCLLSNGKTFTNQDIKELAEKYYGEKLDWFFAQWLFDFKQPEYEVEYAIDKKGKE